MVRVLTVASSLCLLYAALRYHVGLGHGFEDLFLFTANKVASMLAVLFIGLGSLPHSFFIKLPASVKECQRRALTLLGFDFLWFHVLASTLVLTPGYFPKFFSQGKIELKTAAMLFFGVVAFALLLRLVQGHFSPSSVRALCRVALACICFHILLRGGPGWIQADTWPLSLPPISLLMFVLSTLFLLANLGLGGLDEL